MARMPPALWSIAIQGQSDLDSDTDSDLEGITLPTIPLPRVRGAGSQPQSHPAETSSRRQVVKPPEQGTTKNVHPTDIKSMLFAQSSMGDLFEQFKCSRLPPGGRQLLLEMHACLVHTVARTEQQAQVINSYKHK